jgi:hypothetical protein
MSPSLPTVILAAVLPIAALLIAAFYLGDPCVKKHLDCRGSSRRLGGALLEQAGHDGAVAANKKVTSQVAAGSRSKAASLGNPVFAAPPNHKTLKRAPSFVPRAQLPPLWTAVNRPRQGETMTGPSATSRRPFASTLILLGPTLRAA